MMKLLLASVLAIASIPGAHAANVEDDSGEGMACYDDGTGCRPCKNDQECEKGLGPRPSARVTVAPPYQGPPPIGWSTLPIPNAATHHAVLWAWSALQRTALMFVSHPTALRSWP
jgi:hypothetical protein